MVIPKVKPKAKGLNTKKNKVNLRRLLILMGMLKYSELLILSGFELYLDSK